MIDLRPILFVCGLLLSALGVLMMVPSLIDAATGHPDWPDFAISAMLTLYIGGGLMLSNRMDRYRMTLRETFVMTALSWSLVAVFAAVPMTLSRLGLSYTDALFEAMSGITTTGSTVIQNLDAAAPGLLMWRAMLQWIGGIGIIVTALAVLPMLRVGGMQLFRSEGAEGPEQVLPNAAYLASGIGAVYAGFTVALTIALWLAGMSGFDAIIHAMSAIATGGFSSKDASVAFFDSTMIQWILVVGMIAGSLPFIYYVDAVRGRPGPLLRDSQVRWFFGIAALATALILGALWLGNDEPFGRALRLAIFHVVSIMSGTGLFAADFSAWGSLAAVTLMGLMFVGGCAGSTTGGIKVFRFQVALQVARAQIARLVQPHGVFLPYYNRRPIADEVSMAVIGFFFAYILCFIVLALGLGLLGLDFLTSLSAAAASISNVGPGISERIGPTGSFATLPDEAKWLLSVGMLVGRLEIYTLLVLFMPSFWRG